MSRNSQEINYDFKYKKCTCLFYKYFCIKKKGLKFLIINYIEVKDTNVGMQFNNENKI